MLPLVLVARAGPEFFARRCAISSRSIYARAIFVPVRAGHELPRSANSAVRRAQIALHDPFFPQKS
jgi:hypothetical protein